MVKFGNAVFVVIFNKDTKSFVLVKQFRPAVYARKMLERASENSEKLPESEGVTLELCAGLIDKQGKSVAQHAKEEILEETGYDVCLEKIEPIKCFVGAIGIAGIENTMYYAEVSNADRKNAGGGVDSEMIDVVDIPFADMKRMVTEPNDTEMVNFDANLMMGIYWFMHSKVSQYDL